MATTAASADGEPLRAYYALEDLIMAYTKSFAVKAIVELGIPDMLAKAGGQLTLEEIAAQLSGKAVSVEYLGRIMIYAAVNGLFTQASESGDGSIVDEKKRFGLTPLSRLLVEEESDDPGMSMAHVARFLAGPPFMQGYNHLAGAVRSGTNPFELENGMTAWEMWKANPEWGSVVNKSMAAGTLHVVRALVKVYDGFEGVKRLVDVGGGTGTSLTVITEAYRQIEGVNFDLPQVIAMASEIPGITHVSGDMFKSVPEGDAIFIKRVLHNWTDEDCVQILQNCCKALTADGKLIIVDRVVSDPEKGTPFEYMYDMRMLNGTVGRERTAGEWRRLLQRSGFHRVKVIPHLGVIEAYGS